MKKLITLSMIVAGLTAHAAVNQATNSSCSERHKGPLWEVTQEQPKAVKKEKPATAPTQEASIKQKAQRA